MMNKLVKLLVAVSLFFMGTATMADEPTTPDWPTIHGGAVHTGYYPYSIDPPYKVVWSEQTYADEMNNVIGFWDNSEPNVVYEDIMGLKCKSPDGGKFYWQYEREKDFKIDSGLVASNSKGQKYFIFVTYSRKIRENKLLKLVCLDMAGKKVWTDDIQGNLMLCHMTAQDGYLYIPTAYISGDNTDRGILHKARIDDGKGIWSAFIPATPVNSAPTKVDNRIYLSTQPIDIYNYADFDFLYGGHFLAIDDANGQVMRDIKYNRMLTGFLSVYDSGCLIIAGQMTKETTITEKDPKTGRMVTKKVNLPYNFIQGLAPVSLDPLWELTPPEVNDSRVFLCNTPVVSKDWIVIGAKNDKIYAFNRKDQSKNWSIKAGSFNYLSLVITDKYLHYFDGKAYKTLDLETREVVSTAEFKSKGMGCISIFDNYIFVMVEGEYGIGYIYCITKGKRAKLAVESKTLDLGQITTSHNDYYKVKAWNEGDEELTVKIKASEPYVTVYDKEMILGDQKKDVRFDINLLGLEYDTDYQFTLTVTPSSGIEETVTVKFRYIRPPKLDCYPKTIVYQPKNIDDCIVFPVLIRNAGNPDLTLKGYIGCNHQICNVEPSQWETKTFLTVNVSIDVSQIRDRYMTNRTFVSLDSNGGYFEVRIIILPFGKLPASDGASKIQKNSLRETFAL